MLFPMILENISKRALLRNCTKYCNCKYAPFRCYLPMPVIPTTPSFSPFPASEDCPVFGVPLEVACQRHKSHDGVPLPVVVRVCVDHIEEVGLMQEGIYREEKDDEEAEEALWQKEPSYLHIRFLFSFSKGF